MTQEQINAISAFVQWSKGEVFSKASSACCACAVFAAYHQDWTAAGVFLIISLVAGVIKYRMKK